MGMKTLTPEGEYFWLLHQQTQSIFVPKRMPKKNESFVVQIFKRSAEIFRDA